MLRFIWQNFTLGKDYSPYLLHVLLERYRPDVIALDTETSGLHIINDKPFVVQIGFKTSEQTGVTFAIETANPQFELFCMSLINYLKTKKVTLIGHNLKYDLHMMANIDRGIVELCEDNPNLTFTDTAFYIRYAHDALHTDEGGPPMKLKEYAARYIDPDAKTFEQELDREKSAITKAYNVDLRKRLKKTQKEIDVYFKEVTFEPSDLPEDMRQIYLEWLSDLPLQLREKVTANVSSDLIPYPMLNRQNLLKYAHYDIVYTLEIYYSLLHVIEGRDQWTGIRLEEKTMLAFYRMERTGFEADAEYLEASRKRLKETIHQKRAELFEIAEEEFTVNQHELFKRIIFEKFGTTLTTSGKEALELVKENAGPDAPITDFINRVQELRTLEKWYSAYILRFQKDLKHNNRLYTQINQVGTVSGRVTSDFQQFPKSPIKDSNEKEIFHPRRIIRTSYAIAYLDYSQIELRVQAFYTMLLGNPDLNMCRAYMPFKCIEREGKWYLEESPEVEWTPVDVHSETTKAATGLDESHPDFKKLRTDIGKKVNFSKNYGAELKRIRSMFPHKTLEECKRINDSYYKAFPGVKGYHKYCNDRAVQFSNTQSLFGIRYYNVSGHKLKNLLVQGSSAHLLKLKISQIDQLIKDEDEHIRMQMQIHDELSFDIYDEEGFSFIPKIKKIMEDWDDCAVPIIAEYEVTRTNWAEKGHADVPETCTGH